MSADKAIRWYSYGIIAFCVLGATGVHIPYWMGIGWSTYKAFPQWQAACSWVLHFFETPLIAFNLYVAYYGLNRFTKRKKDAYISLLDNAFAAILVFFTVECFQFFFSFPNGAANWEKIAYGGIVLLMLLFIIFLLYVKQRVLSLSMSLGIEPDDDGFYHPDTEADLVVLVKKAVSEKRQIRCRGAAHSMAHAIYSDPSDYPNKVSQQTPPFTSHINIMLDKYNGFKWLDEKKGIVEVEAGIHLGRDPNDYSESSPLKSSLLHQAWLKDFTLEDLGGITHQTISGFMMTGSAGGSLTHNVEESILEFSMIDGHGNVNWFDRNHPQYHALLVSMGLQGIVSKVRLQLAPMFIIKGEEKTVPVEPGFPIDFYKSASLNSLESFFRGYTYGRLLWWPQKKVERVVIWRADRRPVPKPFEPVPYIALSKNKLVALFIQMMGSTVFMIMGNNFFSYMTKIHPPFKAFKVSLHELLGPGFGAWIGAWLVANICKLVAIIAGFVAFPIKSLESKKNPFIAPFMIDLLQKNTKPGKEKRFADYPLSSLPMDNEMNDTILSTAFTEIWVPFNRHVDAMNLLHNLYVTKGYESTGYYATELYATKASRAWMSPAYQTEVLRIDIFWFSHNTGDPAAAPDKKNGFFYQFWDAMRSAGIPFRLHWGKYLPGYEKPGNDFSLFQDWADYFDSQYPQMKEFLELRTARDPHDIFLNNYWSLHLLGKPK